jgi:hypothetical protein
MSKVIIGIHGLNNKPAEAVLANWWLKAIKEGLTRNCPDLAAGDVMSAFEFKLAYWASEMYGSPIKEGEELEPYSPAEGVGPLPSGEHGIENLLAHIRAGLVKGGETAAAAVARKAVDDAIAGKAPDVSRYRSDFGKRKAVQDGLVTLLKNAHDKGQEVMLIGHSMGSFIAYDVLANRDDLPREQKITHFVTLGSPLGLHEVKAIVNHELRVNSENELEEGEEKDLRVPHCVSRWSNFADPYDRVARWDTDLSTDYHKNSSGVKVSDHLVCNTYVIGSGESRKENHHKIYGYLRTPEMSKAIADFAQ